LPQLNSWSRFDEQPGTDQSLIAGNQARVIRIQQSLEEDQQNLASIKQICRSCRVEIEAAHSSATGQNPHSRQPAPSFCATRKDGKADGQRQKSVERQGRKAAELAGLQAQLEVFQQAEALLTGYTPGSRLLLELPAKVSCRASWGR
jgi:hypothetical protein